MFVVKCLPQLQWESVSTGSFQDHIRCQSLVSVYLCLSHLHLHHPVHITHSNDLMKHPSPTATISCNIHQPQQSSHAQFFAHSSSTANTHHHHWFTWPSVGRPFHLHVITVTKRKLSKTRSSATAEKQFLAMHFTIHKEIHMHNQNLCPKTWRTYTIEHTTNKIKLC